MEKDEPRYVCNVQLHGCYPVMRGLTQQREARRYLIRENRRCAGEEMYQTELCRTILDCTRFNHGCA